MHTNYRISIKFSHSRGRVKGNSVVPLDRKTPILCMHFSYLLILVVILEMLDVMPTFGL